MRLKVLLVVLAISAAIWGALGYRTYHQSANSVYWHEYSDDALNISILYPDGLRMTSSSRPAEGCDASSTIHMIVIKREGSGLAYILDNTDCAGGAPFRQTSASYLPASQVQKIVGTNPQDATEGGREFRYKIGDLMVFPDSFDSGTESILDKILPTITYLSWNAAPVSGVISTANWKTYSNDYYTLSYPADYTQRISDEGLSLNGPTGAVWVTNTTQDTEMGTMIRKVTVAGNQRDLSIDPSADIGNEGIGVVIPAGDTAFKISFESRPGQNGSIVHDDALIDKILSTFGLNLNVSVDTTGWKKYTDTNFGFEFKYPSQFKLATGTDQFGSFIYITKPGEYGDVAGFWMRHAGSVSEDDQLYDVRPFRYLALGKPTYEAGEAGEEPYYAIAIDLDPGTILFSVKDYCDIDTCEYSLSEVQRGILQTLKFFK